MVQTLLHPFLIRSSFIVIVLAALAPGCSRAHTHAPHAGSTPENVAVQANEADVRFMRDMIPHHAQALVIAGWAPSHDAGADVRRLTERLIVAQRDEIDLAATWLRSHGAATAATDSFHSAMPDHGAGHSPLMPGMLTTEQLQKLDAARGAEFDRLFLQYMIQHHEGALAMVDQLFASPGAARDDAVFRFASDVFADQSAEIERMQRMLDAMAAQP